MLRGEVEKNHELLRGLFSRKLHTPIAAFCVHTMSTLKQKKIQNSINILLINKRCTYIQLTIFKNTKVESEITVLGVTFN